MQEKYLVKAEFTEELGEDLLPRGCQGEASALSHGSRDVQDLALGIHLLKNS